MTIRIKICSERGEGAAKHTGGSRSGFTLIELLVVVTLLALVVGLLMYPLVAGFTFLGKGKARQEVNAATRFAVDTMARELGQAIDVLVADGRRIVFVLPNMRTFCPVRSAHAGAGWQQGADGQWFTDRYLYYCAEHQTATVTHELIEPVVPMRDKSGARVAVVYCRSSEVPTWVPIAPGEFVARAVVPFPDDPTRLTDWQAWLERLSGVNPGALTPSGENFEVPRLVFRPTAVTDEVLTPSRRLGESDWSLYRSRYPLWGDEWTIRPEGIGGDQVDTRSGTVSFARHETIRNLTAAYLPQKPAMPPALVIGGPIIRETDVVMGPPDNRPFSRTATASGDLPPLLDPPQDGEYWIDYEVGLVYVAPGYVLSNPPPAFVVGFMRAAPESGQAIIASYRTYALLNIDLTVRKIEAETGVAGSEGVLGQRQDFHVSAKVKLANVCR